MSWDPLCYFWLAILPVASDQDVMLRKCYKDGTVPCRGKGFDLSLKTVNGQKN